MTTPATVAPTIRIRARPKPDANTAGLPADERAASSVDDDAVGYGRPPKQHQFKPGQSGNPKGRPKGARGFSALVREICEEQVDVRLLRGSKRMKVVEVVVRRVLEQASKGDLRSALAALKLYQMASPEPIAGIDDEGSLPPLDATDEMIIAQFKQSLTEGGAA